MNDTSGVEYARRMDEWLKESEAHKTVEMELYRLKRYNTPSTIALCEIPDARYETHLRRRLRQTDHIIPLGQNHCFVIFSNTDLSGAEKAMRKIVAEYNDATIEQSYRIAMKELKKEEDAQEALRRLLVLFVLNPTAKMVMESA